MAVHTRFGPEEQTDCACGRRTAHLRVSRCRPKENWGIYYGAQTSDVRFGHKESSKQWQGHCRLRQRFAYQCPSQQNIRGCRHSYLSDGKGNRSASRVEVACPRRSSAPRETIDGGMVARGVSANKTIDD